MTKSPDYKSQGSDLSFYRYDHAVKTVKASVLSWGDKDGYSGAGSYWTYEYCVRAYKIVNGKRVYSKKTKTVTI